MKMGLQCPQKTEGGDSMIVVKSGSVVTLMTLSVM